MVTLGHSPQGGSSSGKPAGGGGPRADYVDGVDRTGLLVLVALGVGEAGGGG